jgi:hypothetical protein
MIIYTIIIAIILIPLSFKVDSRGLHPLVFMIIFIILSAPIMFKLGFILGSHF